MRARLGLLALALVLTACGSSTPADSTPESGDPSESTAVVTTEDFAAPIDLGDGVSVIISVPVAFTPGDFASNYLPGQTSNVFTIDVANSGKSALDLSTVLFTPTSGGNFCIDVLDGDNGIVGAPTEPVAAGGSVSFKYAIACDARPGDPLELGIVFGDVNSTLAGQLA